MEPRLFWSSWLILRKHCSFTLVVTSVYIPRQNKTQTIKWCNAYHCIFSQHPFLVLNDHFELSLSQWSLQYPDCTLPLFMISFLPWTDPSGPHLYGHLILSSWYLNFYIPQTGVIILCLYHFLTFMWLSIILAKPTHL